MSGRKTTTKRTPWDRPPRTTDAERRWWILDEDSTFDVMECNQNSDLASSVDSYFPHAESVILLGGGRVGPGGGILQILFLHFQQTFHNEVGEETLELLH